MKTESISYGGKQAPLLAHQQSHIGHHGTALIGAGLYATYIT